MPAQMFIILAIALGLSLVQGVQIFCRHRWPFISYLRFIWSFFTAFAVAEFYSFCAGTWIIAIISFLALREYFSMAEIRLQDRLAILGSYASIPFMFHFVNTHWYGMFIVSIPVYGFLAIPLLVSLGGRDKEGTVFSIGVIVFGLFLFVYCLGHVSYLMSYSAWMAAFLILDVAVCDLIHFLLRRATWPRWRLLAAGCFLPMPLTVLLTVGLSPFTTIPAGHSAILGSLIPVLVAMGRHAGNYVEVDLGVAEETADPGRGQILDNLKSLLFAAPVVFHYLRYYLDLP